MLSYAVVYLAKHGTSNLRNVRFLAFIIMDGAQNPYRSHYCEGLEVGVEVKLCGWVDRKRDHGSLIFIDLRDGRGAVQLVFGESYSQNFDQVDSISNESFIVVNGNVVDRSEENFNAAINNGNIEVQVFCWHIESKALTLPFSIHGDEQICDELRLRYRFLDLRRQKLRDNIIIRSQVMHFLNKKMVEIGFYEFNTPILTASSPEGARDYLVPSRNFSGLFYALPQAPQQFKQLLMISGFERYFQLAPCFRDEDARAARTPGDFYQLDIEISCATEDEVFCVVEDVVNSMFHRFVECYDVASFPRITYEDSMLKYGNDKPDLRNPIIIHDVTKIFSGSTFTLFSKGAEQGKVIRALPCETLDLPRSFFDKAIDYSKSVGSQGLAYLQFDEPLVARGPIAKFFDEETIKELWSVFGFSSGGKSVFFVCDEVSKANYISGKVRDYLGKELNLLVQEFRFCWITDFPYFKYDDRKKSLDFFHNPFSMPKLNGNSLTDLPTESLLGIYAHQYDLVCNGVEIASGAIRNHKVELMEKALGLVGYNAEDMVKSFGGLLRALRYGPPPHGGIALGIDRILMLMTREENIREVICFPLSQRGEDLLMGAPSEVSSSHLKELGLQITRNVQKTL